MSGVLIVSGTDTGIGKTVIAAGLAAALRASYWKPIQAGTQDGTDSERAAQLGAVVLSEAHRLALPASPHLAAERAGLTLGQLALPAARPLVVEGAGGLLVPIRRDPPWTMIDQFAQWGAPVLLVARTGLGTINHSLLSIAALRARGLPIAGLIFVGEAHADNETVVPALGQVRSFGRVPILARVDAASVAGAMGAIDLAGIRDVMGL